MTRFTSLLLLVLLASCQSPGWPPPVSLTAAPGTSGASMAEAQQAAHLAGGKSQAEAATAAWLRTAQEAALLIEDKTTCGDGSLSRIQVTRIYQHALGQVLARLRPEDLRGGNLRVSSPQGNWQVTLPAVSSIQPASPKLEFSTLRVGVPVQVIDGEGERLATAILHFEKPWRANTPGRAILRFLEAASDSTTRLHAAGPEIPLREARQSAN